MSEIPKAKETLERFVVIVIIAEAKLAKGVRAGKLKGDSVQVIELGAARTSSWDNGPYFHP